MTDTSRSPLVNAPAWRKIEDQPDFDHRPCRQFVLLEGDRFHSDVYWRRVHCGEAYIRKPGTEGELYGYRETDILRLCKDGDMSVASAKVTHWMPATFPPFPEASR